MSVKVVNGTKKTTTARTAEDAPATPITGSRPTARIKIPIDRLPEAPEPTLPYHADERPAGMTFALSRAEEQYRRRADRAEM